MTKEQSNILSTQITALFSRHDSQRANEMLSDLAETKAKRFVGVWCVHDWEAA